MRWIYNDYLNILSTEAAYPEEWTIECWFFPKNTDGNQVLFSKEGLFEAGFNGDQFKFVWTDGNSETYENLLTIASAKWHHIAISYDRSDQLLRFHLHDENGELGIKDQSVSADHPPLESELLIGAAAAKTPGRFFTGKLAEVRFWDAALSAAAVTSNYRQNLLGWEAYLLGYWPLNEGSGDNLKEFSQIVANGAIIAGLENAAEKWQAETPPLDFTESSIQLDGRDDHVILPDSAQFSLDRDFTVEALIKPADLESDILQPVLGSSSPQSADKDNQALCIGIKSGHPFISFFNNDFHPAIELEADWHHITWQYDAARQTMRIIVDQLPAQTDTASHAPFRGSGNLYIGRWQDWDDTAQAYNSHHFNGFISEVRIWNSLRTEAEVRESQTQRLNGDEETLAGYWVFDDVYRSLLTSKVSQDNNLYFMAREFGKVQNTPEWQDINDHPLLSNHLNREAFSFDGGLQYLAADGVQLSGSSFTLEAWVKHQQDASGVNNPILWKGKRTSSSTQTDFELRVTDTRMIEFRYRQTEDAPDAPLKVVTSSAAISADIFTHVAVIIESAAIRLYINGTKRGDAAISPLANQGNILLLGRSEADAVPEHFKGQLQELRLWDTLRSVSEIKSAMHLPLADPLQLPLAGYWPLAVLQSDETSPDLSANSNNMQLGGLVDARKPSVGAISTSASEFFSAGPAGSAASESQKLTGLSHSGLQRKYTRESFSKNH